MDSFERGRYRRTASGITALAHLLGVLAILLVLLWLLHFREGIYYDSGNPDRVFNVHPFLMVFGFVFFAGEAIMAYKTVPAERTVQKFAHMVLHFIAIVLGIVGLCAAFKYHNMLSVKHMTSLHSWIGMGTICLYILQWLFGFSVFWLPSASYSTRATAVPWHICGGRALLYMAIASALTGLMQKELLQQLGWNGELRLINFTGLAILLFGIAVDFSIGLAHYV
ncbi:probable transmembrane ascorbate ferrireductase 3 [Rhododendron vialii]|uniref:probable transmembrane ascorbate ferrireductase 3 n=1 Tax=Rhododendron vialii TaxID=182163 RepID=UPI00265F5C5B|nr:probable transmembrane ascorbate ferrireductase 3 [Rhododendron vialii]